MAFRLPFPASSVKDRDATPVTPDDPRLDARNHRDAQAVAHQGLEDRQIILLRVVMRHKKPLGEGTLQTAVAWIAPRIIAAERCRTWSPAGVS